MLKFICARLLYWATVVPLPTLVAAILVTMLGNAADISLITGFATLLLWVVAIAFMLSIVLAVACGLIRKSKILLFPAFLAMLDIALFVIFLPEDETAVGWRFIDYVLVGGLVALNVIQWLVLRREATYNRISGDDDDF